MLSTHILGMLATLSLSLSTRQMAAANKGSSSSSLVLTLALALALALCGTVCQYYCSVAVLRCVNTGLLAFGAHWRIFECAKYCGTTIMLIVF